ncbi:MAG: glycosyltransferase [Chloroflexota bacterium]|nr:glycosyltransferase [Dehalococcoidia bacterium]MDW8253450.1 glycosyltransferase [Chloroflexota bacterium]
MTSERLRVSIGVTAYNEEANIGRLLEALLAQELATVEISEIIVVASGCTDRTHEIVESYAAKDPRVRLLVQPRREGKTAAINLFLSQAKEDIVVVQSGDTLVRHDTIEHLIKPFFDPTIGMTGAQKVPVNASDQFIGYMSHLRLQLEHQLCLEVPRLGELIAFRKLIDAIPTDVAMDEAFMEAFIIQRGLRVVYAPNAVVYNMGPESIAEFIRQRRRNHAGHLHLKHKYGYKVASLNSAVVARLAAQEIYRLLRMVVFIFTAGALELFARMLGAYDYYIRGRKHVIWEMAWSTKRVDLEKASLPPAVAPRPPGLREAK